MCVIFFAYKKHPDFPLILLANRDEFYSRPTAAARYWHDFPEIYGGRDLVHGGTWLGITKTGRIAAVTNYRQPDAPKGNISRGILAADFLKSGKSPTDYLSEVRRQADSFSGFNLLVGHFNGKNSEIAYFSNRQNEIKILEPGIYGLSNHLLDTPWRKVAEGKKALIGLINDNNLNTEKLFEILQDKILADDAELPNTGIGYDLEKLLSAIFIETPIYGTRSSSLVLADRDGNVTLEERVYR
jgi:uncharacterized protein with NRDE domain